MKQISKWISDFEAMEPALKTDLQYIESNLKELFKDESVMVNGRVKTIKSLHEKIIRNRYIFDHEEEENIFDFLKDPIGIRIICLEQKNEKSIYELLVDMAQKNKIPASIVFDDTIKNQPEPQKNEHPIYRINGIFNNRYFELQIKSLSHMLWGEIEHLLFYKNYSINIGTSYYKTQIEQIYCDLLSINNRLSHLKQHMNNNTESVRITEVKEISMKIIQNKSTKYIKEIYGGIELDFRDMYKAVVDHYYCDYSETCHENDGIYNRLQSLIERANTLSQGVISNIIQFTSEKELIDEKLNRIYQIIKSLIENNDPWAIYLTLISYIEDESIEDFIVKKCKQLRNLYIIEFENYTEDDIDYTSVQTFLFELILKRIENKKKFIYIREIFLERLSGIIQIMMELVVISGTVFNDLPVVDFNELIENLFDIAHDLASLQKVKKDLYLDFLQNLELKFDNELLVESLENDFIQENVVMGNINLLLGRYSQ